MSASTFWLNGEFIDGAPPERGIEGVFDTLLAVNGKPNHLADHYARLIHDIETILGAAWIPAFAGMPEIIQTLAQPMNFARVRTSVTREMVLVEAFPCPDPAALGPLTCVIIDAYARVAGDPLENCKRLDYTRNFAARALAQAIGADDAIMTNSDGNIACGATANLFIEENGVLITPPLSDGVLAGVTRRKIVDGTYAPHPNPPPIYGGREERRQAFGWGVREESITKKRLIAADKAFLSNSLIGLREMIVR